MNIEDLKYDNFFLKGITFFLIILSNILECGLALKHRAGQNTFKNGFNKGLR